MTNEATQDAEESATIEKTAIETSESTTAAPERTAETDKEPVPPETTSAVVDEAAPVKAEGPAAETVLRDTELTPG